MLFGLVLYGQPFGTKQQKTQTFDKWQARPNYAVFGGQLMM